jgi:hypothetical protein
MTKGEGMSRTACPHEAAKSEMPSVVLAMRLAERAGQDFRALLDRACELDRIIENTKPRPSSVVYFVAFGSRVKIGRTTDLDARLKQLQRMNPRKLRLLGYVAGAAAEEAEIHRRFAHLRKHGEWFRLDSDLKAFVRGLAE